jgi:chromosome partitioning protein
MQTIVWSSQKGGSGKSGLCSCCGVEAERAEDGPVYLIDADHQGTLSTWHEIRQAERPHRVEIEIPDLRRVTWRTEAEREAEAKFLRDGLTVGLRQVAERGAALCFIDTPPTDNENVGVTFEFADLVLVPVRPTPSDLWAVKATGDLLTQVAVPFLFVVNQANLRANITAQAIGTLSHYGPVAETIIAFRTLYAAAMTDGHTAPELARTGPEAKEITALWRNIKACLHASMPATNNRTATHA